MLKAARSISEDVGGFDDRLLLKIQLREGEQLPDLNAMPGIELVSQEDKTLALAFADQQGLREFEQRLSSLARDGRAPRAQLLYALEDFDHWTPEDRTGHALAQFGLPQTETIVLDIELWPQERHDRREALFITFQVFLKEAGVEILDTVRQPSLAMFRVRYDREFMANRLLHHRDVRTVDFPPRAGIAVRLLTTDMRFACAATQNPIISVFISLVGGSISPALIPARLPSKATRYN